MWLLRVRCTELRVCSCACVQLRARVCSCVCGAQSCACVQLRVCVLDACPGAFEGMDVACLLGCRYCA